MVVLQKLFLFCYVSFFLANCAVQDPSEQIISESIRAHGLSGLDNGTLAFTFRNRGYTYEREYGRFEYQRIQKDSLENEIIDRLTNEGLTRFINDVESPLSSKDSTAYASSVNSVIYFALLPYFLKDPAVQLHYLGIRTVKGQDYHRIKVGFEVEGGGKDYQDEFVYWIDTETYLLEYLAYNYLTDGGGARFRTVRSRVSIGDMVINQYDNWKPVPMTMEVGLFDSLYEAGKMQFLSTIELENIKVD